MDMVAGIVFRAATRRLTREIYTARAARKGHDGNGVSERIVWLGGSICGVVAALGFIG